MSLATWQFFHQANDAYHFSFMPEVMNGLYLALSMLQLIFVVIMTPLLVANSICKEYEKKTFDLLRMTKLSIAEIIFGKLLFAISFILLLCVVSLPMFSFAFFYGNMGIFDLLFAECYILATALVISGIAMLTSLFFKRTAPSVLLTYLVMGIVFFGSLSSVILQLATGNFYLSLSGFISNPLLGFFSLLAHQTHINLSQDIFIFSKLHTEIATTFQKNCANNLHYIAMTMQIVVGSICIFLSVKFLDGNAMRNKNVRTVLYEDYDINEIEALSADTDADVMEVQTEIATIETEIQPKETGTQPKESAEVIHEEKSSEISF